jgi:hypothetical protein
LPFTVEFINITQIKLFGETQVGLVVTPPTNLGATFRWCPTNVFLAGLDVGEVTPSENAGDNRARNHGVGGGIFQPDRFVLDVVNDFAAGDKAAVGDRAHAKQKLTEIMMSRIK